MYLSKMFGGKILIKPKSELSFSSLLKILKSPVLISYLRVNNLERFDAGNLGNLINQLFGCATNNILYLLQSSRLHLSLSSFLFVQSTKWSPSVIFCCRCGILSSWPGGTMRKGWRSCCSFCSWRVSCTSTGSRRRRSTKVGCI